jgi:tetratricopeptide (TPR) repeat protein
MTGMSKLSIIALLLTLLVTGCDEAQKRAGVPVPILNSEQRKGQLLRQLERRYENPQAHYELGRIYHTDGLWVKAEAQYRTAVGFDPVLWDAEAAIVKLLVDAGNTSKSARSAEAAIERAKFFKVNAMLDLAKAFQKQYLDEYALKCHTQALILAPESAAVYKTIGYYYLSKHDLARAEMNLRQSFEIDPYQPEVSGELGRLGIIVEVPGIYVSPSLPEVAEEVSQN